MPSAGGSIRTKYGNDNQAAVGGDRAFTDSDAITLGSAGEIIRAALVWNGKCWFFTNQQGHYIGGYGRDSFLTDGATAIVRSQNVVGPHALIEGPDRALYGVGDHGLWRTTDGNTFEPLYEKLRDFDGVSTGYWDLIWTDAARTLASYPGRTNQDLVWMAVDWDRHQVLIGIPWCDAAQGFGYGLDTVVIKYHTLTGGFTRQVFAGIQYTAAGYFRREGQQQSTRFMGTATAGATTIQTYGARSASSSPMMPSPLPSATFGPYAPFGPTGRGSLKRLYLTVAWEAVTALPIDVDVTTTWDQATSGTDLNIGNGTASGPIGLFPAHLLNRWTGTTWSQLPGVGSNGLRATVRLPLDPRNGTRVTVVVACVAAGGRFQLESLGELPGGGQPSA